MKKEGKTQQNFLGSAGDILVPWQVGLQSLLHKLKA